MPKVITANRLTDGIVVYAGHDGAWAGLLSEAKVFASKAEAETGLLIAQNDAKRNLVVEPCLIDVTDDSSGLRALTLRESIRARGPTIDFLPQKRVFAYEADPAPGSKPKNKPKQETQARLRIPGPENPRKHELMGATGSPDDIAG